MAPQLDQELVIVRLSFFPYEHPEHPRILMERKDHSPSASKPHLREWYSRVLCKETENLPPNCGLTFCEWHISSSDASLFIVNGHRYDSILLILGEEMAHWVYYKNFTERKRIEGCAVLPVNFCSCCLDTQYLKILDAIKSIANIKGN